ncbi:MAG: MarR family transcriptional regulator, partial [Clostridia bacterium]|nr:MarR family transcriptional regulator [Clostridia bacterium]
MMEQYDPLKLENQLCFPLYAASREVIKQYHPLLSELDLTYTQYVALMVLWETGEISAKEMGERLHLDSGTLTPLLKGLEKRGLVTRSRFEKDERV